MKVMNIGDLQELGFTTYQIRTCMEGFNSGEKSYDWVAQTLIQQGAKKPKVDAERFVEAYRQFQIEQINAAMDRIQNKLREGRVE